MSLPSKSMRIVRALHTPIRGEATDYLTVERTFILRCASVCRYVSWYNITRTRLQWIARRRKYGAYSGRTIYHISFSVSRQQRYPES